MFLLKLAISIHTQWVTLHVIRHVVSAAVVLRCSYYLFKCYIHFNNFRTEVWNLRNNK